MVVPHIVPHSRPFGCAALEFDFCCCYFGLLLLVLFSHFLLYTFGVSLFFIVFTIVFSAIVNYNLHLGAQTGSCVYSLASSSFRMFSFHTQSFLFPTLLLGALAFFSKFSSLLLLGIFSAAPSVSHWQWTHTPRRTADTFSFFSFFFGFVGGAGGCSSAVYSQRKYLEYKNELFTLKFN